MIDNYFDKYLLFRACNYSDLWYLAVVMKNNSRNIPKFVIEIIHSLIRLSLKAKEHQREYGEGAPISHAHFVGVQQAYILAARHIVFYYNLRRW